jgi:hypothetical protein
MSASNYLEDKILAATLTATTYTSPANVYTALYSTAPTESTTGTELTGNGYSRQITSFTVDTGNGIATNSGNVTFSASGNAWLPATAFGIVDASSSGNILYYGALSPAQALQAGDSLVLTTGNIIVTIN